MLLVSTGKRTILVIFRVVSNQLETMTLFHMSHELVFGQTFRHPTSETVTEQQLHQGHTVWLSFVII